MYCGLSSFFDFFYCFFSDVVLCTSLLFACVCDLLVEFMCIFFLVL